MNFVTIPDCKVVTKTGEYFENGHTNLDLFMKKEKKQYWINVLKLGAAVVLSNDTYPSEQEALSNLVDNVTILKTILIHEEEE